MLPACLRLPLRAPRRGCAVVCAAARAGPSSWLSISWLRIDRFGTLELCRSSAFIAVVMGLVFVPRRARLVSTAGGIALVIVGPLGVGGA